MQEQFALVILLERQATLKENPPTSQTQFVQTARPRHAWGLHWLLSSQLIYSLLSMPPKKTSSFNPSCVEKYGLRIAARHPQTQKVVSVECRFCAEFGRECNIGAKRKATCNVHFFTSFRADQIKAHLENQHPNKWEEEARQMKMVQLFLPCFLTSSCNYAVEILILLSTLIANDFLLDGLPQELI
ncbi:hypothetical protein PsorP6_012249 [Peronosclerospora sorghi]|uniref:Uncharacterized protein n=1 Tax=Peronosclerospora sorghi TaxID=230839 RepID=A0ACC0WJZ1_9STRA|nr:hypothetical protein PsorP6_012249 [Peronosclerospora sorghi]